MKTELATPVHPGGLNASQSLAFFRTHGIKGQLIPTRHRRQELRAYTCYGAYVDGSMGQMEYRILALPGHHV